MVCQSEPIRPQIPLDSFTPGGYVENMNFTDHDAYIAAAPEDFRPLLIHLRAHLALALPDVEEVITYNMPGFKIGKAIIAGYAAFSKQGGPYVSASAIEAHAADIATAGLKATKTGVTFSPSKPIPEELIKKLALASRKSQHL